MLTVVGVFRSLIKCVCLVTIFASVKEVCLHLRHVWNDLVMLMHLKVKFTAMPVWTMWIVLKKWPKHWEISLSYYKKQNKTVKCIA